ncbi:WD repeat-containing protein 55 homolog [Sitophilus oryzae]|uniref:WD repeat-containing protein 55 homolog n=1 Tax=Sitophilus oryzae TaxID=7048 RepID=A0A6J2XBA2_SITOR|nr:WD repeat-containing protein 55 homolog [Sitophilus oryzae]XP_030748100.1 WD repeat-containing protein 55 homolog [Sitophilus oryzae]
MDSDSDSSTSDNEYISEESDESISDKKTEIEDDSEDEVIKAIKRECERKNNHPPVINCDDFITDICFHPVSDILAVGSILGDVIFYKYSTEENQEISRQELHTKACRDLEFSEDGKLLYTTSKDKSIMISDVESEKLIKFYENAHDCPIYCLSIIDESMFATGDDDGTIKLWDSRQKDGPIYKTKRNEDYISDIVTDEAHRYLLCSSGDGSLTTLNLEKRCVQMQSEEYDEELTCLGLFRTETKLIAGSSKGKLFIYNWNEFGLHSDAFPGPKTAINCLIPATENIVITGGEDGNIRATHLFPHRQLGIVGQHDMSVEHMDICNDGTFIASSGHNNEIKFWNIQYFEQCEKVSSKHKKHERKKDLENNLPSSKIKNVSDFFSDLT